MANPMPTNKGFVPELWAISSTTGPITATVAPALIRFVRLAPMATTSRINAIPESIPKGANKAIILSASHPAAPDALNTVPRLMAPA